MPLCPTVLDSNDRPAQSTDVLPGQVRKHPVPETGDHRLNGVLVVDLDSGCVPDVSLPATFQARTR
jgi:hypothetical protein